MTHENQPNEPAAKPDDAASEQKPTDRPQVWIGSLSDYNNGILYGEWMDAAREPEEIHESIQRLLAESPTAAKCGDPAEEWGIFDHEGFGSYSVGEYENIETVARIAKGIAEHGEAFAAWADHCGGEPEQLDKFDEAFLGHYESVKTWITGLVDDLGYEDLLDQALPEGIRRYACIDTDQLATDMQLGGDVSAVSAPGGGVWVFDAHV